jgi:hypothetical protein
MARAPRLSLNQVSAALGRPNHHLSGPALRREVHSGASMNASIGSHKWKSLAGVSLLLIASILCFVCVFPGIRPGWLREYYIVRVSHLEGVVSALSLSYPG